MTPTLLPELRFPLIWNDFSYKQERELETYDVEASLADDGFEVPALISNKLELSEYETSYEAMGLPRYFGRQRRRRH